jgi:acetyl-CoA synthetase (ADP-forming)
VTAEPGRSPATARDYARARSLLAAARARNQRALSEPEAKAILHLCEIPTPAGGVAASGAEARALAAGLRPPLALKIVSPDILHKSDIGGVELNVAGDAEAEAAYERITRRVRERLPEARLDGVLVEEMASGGIEVVASVTRDPQLGPVLMVGLGGLWVELLRDVSFRLVPVDRADVVEMLGELQAAPVLSGARGGVAVDRDALVDALLALNDLSRELGEDVREVEINPLMVSSHGVSAIDAVILLQGET